MLNVNKIIEELNVHEVLGNYPTDVVRELLSQLSDIVWDTDDQEIIDTYYQYLETFDLVGQYH
tara:strand:+ start:782 stop:970 length:189 start_codon:yes stop_codon:yes gene_type:complete